MKRSPLAAVSGRYGFIRTILVPVWERRDLRFGFIDITMLTALFVGGIAALRVLAQ